jgi:HlyD family secretion protein
MKRLIVLLTTTLLLTACGSNQEKNTPTQIETTPTQVVGIGKVVPQGGVIQLAAPSSGIVREVYRKAGEQVQEGELILSLYSSEEELAVREADSRVRSQELAVESARILMEQQRFLFTEQERQLKDAKELLVVGATTGENVRTLQNEFDRGAEQMKKLENDFRLQQSQLNELKIQRATKAENLQKKEFRAPTAGTLLDLTPNVGESVSQYQQYAKVAPDKPLMVMAEIDELFAHELKVGQTCKIYIHSNSEVAATGEIVRISPDLKKKSLFSESGTDLQDRRIREIEVSLIEVKKPLFIESKVECSVHLN